MSHLGNDQIRETFLDEIGSLTIDEFQNRCELYGVKDAVQIIDSIVGELVEKKMESLGD